MSDDFSALLAEVLAIRRDLDDHKVATRNMLRVGPVAERDHKKGVRVQHGTDEEPELGPWVQPSERSGVERDLPNLKEQLLVLAPYGDQEQGISIPFGHSEEKPNPASHADETVVFKRGKVKISVDNKSGVMTLENDKTKSVWDGEKFTSEVDGNKTEQTKSKTEFGEGDVRHKSANIGKDHTHKGVQKGGDNTENPND